MKKVLSVYILSAVAVLSICLEGCTSSPSPFLVFNPNKILPAYVNPLPYEQYDCSQIGTEMESVTKQLDQLYLDVKKKREIDSKAQLWGMAGAMVLGVPGVLAAEHGYKSAKYNDGDEEMRWGYGYYATAQTQYAQLIGELEVLEKASILKECDKRMLPDIPEFRKEFSSFTNKRSRVFHRYECQRRNEDTLEYKSTKEARDAGGKPCIHCKPSDMTKTEERLKKGR
jgi:hypothetical protein